MTWMRSALTDLLPRIAVVGIAGGTLAAYLGRAAHLCELATHFRLYYAVFAFALALIFAARRAPRWALAAAGCLAVNAAFILPWYGPRPVQPAPGAERLRLLHYNVNARNRRSEELFALVRAEQPDLVVLNEVNWPWAAALEELKATMPYAHIAPQREPAGTAVFSRRPFAEDRELRLGPNPAPSILVRVPAGTGVVSILTLHPTAPDERDGLIERNEQLRAAAAVLQELPAPRILIGDLNVTMWSPYYADLERETGLRNARRGFGVRPTWPTQLRLLPFLMIPIDHCLVSPEITVTDLRAGPAIGSDHLPVIVDLAIENGPRMTRIKRIGTDQHP